MIVIGIDPGSAITGYGILTKEGNRAIALDYGCIRTPRGAPASKRRLLIFQAVESLIERYSPDALAIETQYVQHNVRSALQLGRAQAVALLPATMRDIPVFEYAPSKAKIAVTGSGRASKSQVAAMIQRLLNLAKLPPQDAADALALAWCRLHATTGELV